MCSSDLTPAPRLTSGSGSPPSGPLSARATAAGPSGGLQGVPELPEEPASPLYTSAGADGAAADSLGGGPIPPGAAAAAAAGGPSVFTSASASAAPSSTAAAPLGPEPNLTAAAAAAAAATAAAAGDASFAEPYAYAGYDRNAVAIDRQSAADERAPLFLGGFVTPLPPAPLGGYPPHPQSGFGAFGYSSGQSHGNSNGGAGVFGQSGALQHSSGHQHSGGHLHAHGNDNKNYYNGGYPPLSAAAAAAAARDAAGTASVSGASVGGDSSGPSHARSLPPAALAAAAAANSAATNSAAANAAAVAVSTANAQDIASSSVSLAGGAESPFPSPSPFSAASPLPARVLSQRQSQPPPLSQSLSHQPLSQHGLSQQGLSLHAAAAAAALPVLDHGAGSSPGPVSNSIAVSGLSAAAFVALNHPSNPIVSSTAVGVGAGVGGSRRPSLSVAVDVDADGDDSPQTRAAHPAAHAPLPPMQSMPMQGMALHMHSLPVHMQSAAVPVRAAPGVPLPQSAFQHAQSYQVSAAQQQQQQQRSHVPAAVPGQLLSLDHALSLAEAHDAAATATSNAVNAPAPAAAATRTATVVDADAASGTPAATPAAGSAVPFAPETVNAPAPVQEGPDGDHDAADAYSAPVYSPDRTAVGASTARIGSRVPRPPSRDAPGTYVPLSPPHRRSIVGSTRGGGADADTESARRSLPFSPTNAHATDSALVEHYNNNEDAAGAADGDASHYQYRPPSPAADNHTPGRGGSARIGAAATRGGPRAGLRASEQPVPSSASHLSHASRTSAAAAAAADGAAGGSPASKRAGAAAGSVGSRAKPHTHRVRSEVPPGPLYLPNYPVIMYPAYQRYARERATLDVAMYAGVDPARVFEPGYGYDQGYDPTGQPPPPAAGWSDGVDDLDAPPPVLYGGDDPVATGGRSRAAVAAAAAAAAARNSSVRAQGGGGAGVTTATPGRRGSLRGGIIYDELLSGGRDTPSTAGGLGSRNGRLTPEQALLGLASVLDRPTSTLSRTRTLGRTGAGPGGEESTTATPVAGLAITAANVRDHRVRVGRRPTQRRGQSGVVITGPGGGGGNGRYGGLQVPGGAGGGAGDDPRRRVSTAQVLTVGGDDDGGALEVAVVHSPEHEHEHEPRNEHSHRGHTHSGTMPAGGGAGTGAGAGGAGRGVSGSPASGAAATTTGGSGAFSPLGSGAGLGRPPSAHGGRERTPSLGGPQSPPLVPVTLPITRTDTGTRIITPRASFSHDLPMGPLGTPPLPRAGSALPPSPAVGPRGRAGTVGSNAAPGALFSPSSGGAGDVVRVGDTLTAGGRRWAPDGSPMGAMAGSGQYFGHGGDSDSVMRARRDSLPSASVRHYDIKSVDEVRKITNSNCILIRHAYLSLCRLTMLQHTSFFCFAPHCRTLLTTKSRSWKKKSHGKCASMAKNPSASHRASRRGPPRWPPTPRAQLQWPVARARGTLTTTASVYCTDRSWSTPMALRPSRKSSQSRAYVTTTSSAAIPLIGIFALFSVQSCSHVFILRCILCLSRRRSMRRAASTRSAARARSAAAARPPCRPALSPRAPPLCSRDSPHSALPRALPVPRRALGRASRRSWASPPRLPPRPRPR